MKNKDDVRYGGRLHTAPYGDAYIEFGANWVHGGSDQNELFQLARRRHLLQELHEEEDRVCGLYYTSAGQTIDPEISRRCFDLFFQVRCASTE